MNLLDRVTEINKALGAAAKNRAESSKHSDNKEFADALKAARDRKKGREDAVDSILGAANLPGVSDLKKQATIFMHGVKSAGSFNRALNVTQASLPDAFKNQLGRGLLALGEDGFGQNSMATGAALLGVNSPSEALKNILGSMGAGLSNLKLDKNALPQLGKMLADSGLEEDKLNEALSELAALGQGDLAMDDVLRFMQKYTVDLNNRGDGGGLIATEDGLPAMGQFFMSLGLSPEVAKNVTTAFKPGDAVTAADLRAIIAGAGDNTLAPCLSEADISNLKGMLESMGANARDMQNLWDQLAQTKGTLSLEGFLKFVDGVGTGQQDTLSQAQLGDLKTVLDSIHRDQEVQKAMNFDETMLKLGLLGDREVDDNFKDMSPALQALRGGFAQMKESIGSQAGGNFGQGSGQGQKEEQREHHRNMLNTQINSHNQGTTVFAAHDLAQDVQSYGGQESLARQISQKMIYSVRQGIHRLKMNLNPVEMGQLNIELKVKGDKLTAHITAENEETYKALSDEIDSLKEALGQSGIEIANMTISYDNQDSGRREFADLGLKDEAQAAKGESAKDNEEKTADRYQNPDLLVDRLV